MNEAPPAPPARPAPGRRIDPERALASGRRVLREEISALESTLESLGESFALAARWIDEAPGKTVLAGVGKSGLVAQKIAATLSSTGAAAVFMHAGDAAHGDLGIVRPGDVLIALSFSGSTSEVLAILPAARRIGARIIAVTGDPDSPLARKADLVLPVAVRREACPMNLAPSSSTIAMMALGDALALTLAEARGFRPEDFALFHPGGALGRRLLSSAGDLMRGGADHPMALPSAPAEELVALLTRTAFGAVNIVESRENRRLAGIVTDGDIRRALGRREEFFKLRAADLMTPSPVTVRPETPAAEALALMENRRSQISVLPVVDESGAALGLLRLHDLLQIFPSRSAPPPESPSQGDFP